jgi:predicted NBD/HSP70 family sugar kinase
VADAGRAVGRAVADLCNMLNPEAIVVGGDLSRAGDALPAGVRDAVDRHALPGAAGAVRVVAGRLGERAEVLGALTLAVGAGESHFQTRYFANALDNREPAGIALT